MLLDYKLLTEEERILHFISGCGETHITYRFLCSFCDIEETFEDGVDTLSKEAAAKELLDDGWEYVISETSQQEGWACPDCVWDMERVDE